MADGVAAGVGVTAAGDAEDTEWEVTEDIGSTSSSQIDSVLGNSPKLIIFKPTFRSLNLEVHTTINCQLFY